MKLGGRYSGGAGGRQLQLGWGEAGGATRTCSSVALADHSCKTSPDQYRKRCIRTQTKPTGGLVEKVVAHCACCSFCRRPAQQPRRPNAAGQLCCPTDTARCCAASAATAAAGAATDGQGGTGGPCRGARIRPAAAAARPCWATLVCSGALIIAEGRLKIGGACCCRRCSSLCRLLSTCPRCTPAASPAGAAALRRRSGSQGRELLVPRRSGGLPLAAHCSRAERCCGGALDGRGGLGTRLFRARQRILWHVEKQAGGVPGE